jgi:hypothetical protein
MVVGGQIEGMLRERNGMGWDGMGDEEKLN